MAGGERRVPVRPAGASPVVVLGEAEVPLEQDVLPLGVADHPLPVAAELRVVGRQEHQAGEGPAPELLDDLPGRRSRSGSPSGAPPGPGRRCACGRGGSGGAAATSDMADHDSGRRRRRRAPSPRTGLTTGPLAERGLDGLLVARSRMIVRSRPSSPGSLSRMRSRTWSASWTSSPSMSTMTSPASSPASSAAEPGTTSVTKAPSSTSMSRFGSRVGDVGEVGARDAEEGLVGGDLALAGLGGPR